MSLFSFDRHRQGSRKSSCRTLWILGRVNQALSLSPTGSLSPRSQSRVGKSCGEPSYAWNVSHPTPRSWKEEGSLRGDGLGHKYVTSMSYHQYCGVKKELAAGDEPGVFWGEPYVCSQCGESFMWVSHFTHLLRSHRGRNFYMCQGYWQAFHLSLALAEHSKTQEEQGPNPATCGAHASGGIAGSWSVWTLMFSLYNLRHGDEPLLSVPGRQLDLRFPNNKWAPLKPSHEFLWCLCGYKPACLFSKWANVRKMAPSNSPQQALTCCKHTTDGHMWSKTLLSSVAILAPATCWKICHCAKCRVAFKCAICQLSYQPCFHFFPGLLFKQKS